MYVYTCAHIQTCMYIIKCIHKYIYICMKIHVSLYKYTKKYVYIIQYTQNTRKRQSVHPLFFSLISLHPSCSDFILSGFELSLSSDIFNLGCFLVKCLSIDRLFCVVILLQCPYKKTGRLTKYQGAPLKNTQPTSFIRIYQPIIEQN